MRQLISLVSAAALLVGAWSAQGMGLIVVDEAHWGPGWPDHPRIVPPPRPPHPPWPAPPMRIQPHVFAPMVVESCQVDVKINDQVAVTSVDQTFRNPNNRRLEGTFLFPVPQGAQLDKFTMEINGEPVSAELLDAAKARRIYEDIVRKAKDPALLEYEGQDVFKVRIFPIEPNSKKRVHVRYTQLLKQDAGLVGYTLPLSPGKYSRQAIKSLSVKAEIKTARPLKSIYSPTHEVEIRRQGERRATVGYEGSDVSPDMDLVLHFSSENGDVAMNLLTHRADDGQGYFLLLAAPGMDAGDEEVIPKDVAFVLDTSGSMAGKKLDQAKKALLFCVENLNDHDRFEIVRFSTEVDPLFGEFNRATEANRDKAEKFISKLKPLGGTAIDEALKRALALRGGRSASNDDDRPFALIFLTDGLPTVGVTSEKRILENVRDRADGKVRVFCFGIGTDVNTHLLDKITEQTRASSQYVLPTEDLELKVSTFFSKIKDPVLANPTITFDGDVRVSRMHPGTLPDLFRGEQAVLVGRFDGQGKARVILEGEVRGDKRQFTQEVRFRRHTERHEFIPRLWATRQVGYLLDQIRLHGENKELKDEVVQLAREYGLVTPYTAYLIVEDEQRRRVPEHERSLSSLARDPASTVAFKAAADRYRADTSGDLAVTAARANVQLRGASSLGGVAAGQAESAQVLDYVPAPMVPGRQPVTAPPKPQLALQEQSRFAGGRNFFLNADRWVDAQVQEHSEAKRVRIEFGSKEYFELSAKHPEVRPWLALGQNVDFVLNGTIYEIRE